MVEFLPDSGLLIGRKGLPICDSTVAVGIVCAHRWASATRSSRR